MPGQTVTVTWTTTNAGNAATGRLAGPSSWSCTTRPPATRSRSRPWCSPTARRSRRAHRSAAACRIDLADRRGRERPVQLRRDRSTPRTRCSRPTPAGTGESNNQAELDVLSAPDLTVTGLALGPGHAGAGRRPAHAALDGQQHAAPRRRRVPGPTSCQINNADTGSDRHPVAVPADPGAAGLAAGRDARPQRHA